MIEPQTFHFAMQRARIHRAMLIVFMGLLVAIPAFALLTGQKAAPTAGSVFVALVAVPLMWFYYRMAIKPCFPTGIALEIHPDHLVLATRDGMKKIPKQHILSVEGPHHTYWMQRPTIAFLRM